MWRSYSLVLDRFDWLSLHFHRTEYRRHENAIYRVCGRLFGSLLLETSSGSSSLIAAMIDQSQIFLPKSVSCVAGATKVFLNSRKGIIAVFSQVSVTIFLNGSGVARSHLFLAKLPANCRR
jgi:hypothetical protein